MIFGPIDHGASRVPTATGLPTGGGLLADGREMGAGFGRSGLSALARLLGPELMCATMGERRGAFRTVGGWDYDAMEWIFGPFNAVILRSVAAGRILLRHSRR